MRILALIPARGGSKRLPGKNIRILGDKPLIVWSIDVAKNIDKICDILVSTDDVTIASICKDAGALVPWLRPAELATDTASSVDVVEHALDWYEKQKGKVDGILLLQPTSPFRTKESIHKGIDIYIGNGRKPVLAVSPTHAHPMWTLKLDGDYVVPFLKVNALGTRSQDLPTAYVVTGSLYLISPDELRENRSFLGVKTVPLIIESLQEALDIDTEWDWKVAQALLAI
jgi:CMP-N,N'-diacetyllegionaminic acid synthase